jgi:hypothetical protein
VLGPDALCGGWRLLRWEVTTDGVPSLPFGPDAEGLLTYSADGWMQAAIAAAGRTPLSAATARVSADHEVAAAARSYFSYAGRWHLEEDAGRPVVVHEVVLALDPGFVGTTQRRVVDLVGGQLTLSADEPVGERTRHHLLAWHRDDGRRPALAGTNEEHR